MPPAPGAPTAGAALVLLAAGRGQRSGHDTNKVLLPLAGRRVLTWSLTWAAQVPAVTCVLVVVRPDERGAVLAALQREVPGLEVELVDGGSSRHESETRALDALAPRIAAGEVDVVAIHDAARPLSGPAVLRDVIDAAREVGGALPVVQQRGLVPLEVDGPGVDEDVVAVQTPQAFRAEPLLEAYRRAAEEGFDGSDTAACVQRYAAVPVRGLPGRVTNIKITFPEDLFLAEHLLAEHRWRIP